MAAESSRHDVGDLLDPPYRIAAYARALTHIRPYTLNAKVSGWNGSAHLDGVPVTVLGAGSYTVVVRDSSSQVGFRFMGSLDRRTTARFRGTGEMAYAASPVRDRARRLRGAFDGVKILGNGGG